jgi:glycosyltransferase involved in cell wall biosynthesis
VVPASARDELKIALVHNLPPGGARRVVAEHVAQLTDVAITEFCPQTATPVTENAQVVALPQLSPRRPRWARPPFRYLDHFAVERAWREVARLVSRDAPDVILAHPCRFLTAPPLLSWLDFPNVYFCHEPRRVDYEPDVARTRNALTAVPYWPLYELARRGDQASVQSAQSIVTNSHYTAASIRSVYGREAVRIRLGVPDWFVSSQVVTAPTHILSVGALVPSKGHDLVLRAASLTRKRWPVTIVTPRHAPEGAAILGRLAEDLGVTLLIRTAVPDHELVSLYRGALATVYLAAAEPFGLVSIEAQACGSPVVVSAEGGLPETILEGRTGWSVARDPVAAASCLDRLAEPEFRAAMSANASAHGRTYRWDRSADEMRAVMEDAVADKRGVPLCSRTALPVSSPRGSSGRLI